MYWGIWGLCSHKGELDIVPHQKMFGFVYFCKKVSQGW